MGRTTYLLTRDKTYTVDHPDVKIFHDLPKALFAANLNGDDNEIMIAGGAEIYKQAMPYADRIYATVVMEDFEGDAYFPPPLIEDWHIVDTPVVFPFHDEQLDLLYNRCVYMRRTKPYIPLQ
jgi:dihydrofolate reductase